MSKDNNSFTILWDVVNGKKITEKISNKIIFSQDEKYLISVDENINVYDIVNEKDVRSFGGDKNLINDVTISSDNKYIISCSDDKTVKLWNLEHGREIKTFKAHTENIYSIVNSLDLKSGNIIDDYKDRFAPKNNYNISIRDETITVINEKSKKKLITYSSDILKNELDEILISLDENYLILSAEKVFSGPDSIDIINIKKGIGLNIKTKNQINNIIISNNSKYLLYYEWPHNRNRSYSISTLYDLENSKIIQSFQSESVAQFSQDSKYVLYIDYDYVTKLWEISTKENKCSYLYFENNEWLSYKPNGEYNCSDNAYENFCFVNENKDRFEVINENHPIYGKNKKNKLLNDYRINDC